jgi:two-component system chemotaxis response regulator CheY
MTLLPIRVLIVDDALLIRQMLRSILTRSDYQVVGEAADGDEAVNRFRELRPDVVLLDIMMPTVDGMTALRQILAVDPAARVVMCSALDQKHVIGQALDAGARDFINKPFTPESVRDAVRRAMV